MKVVATSIGQVKEVIWKNKQVLTGIYKTPVPEISIKKLFVEGDFVSDSSVHGGENKAVYGYPSEHYRFWQDKYPLMPMPWGTFGENITTEGLFENEMIIGSIYRVGTAVLRVTEPRFPCFKLGIKFDDKKIVAKFMKSRKSGFYLSVIEEGVVRPGDQITLIETGDSKISITDVVSDQVRKKK